MIRAINVSEHKVKMHKHEEFAPVVKRIIQSSLTSAELDKVDVFNMSESSAILGGNKKRLVIMGNHSNNTEAPFDINGTLYHQPVGDGIIITSEDGIMLAEYRALENEYNVLNILFDVFKTFDTAHIDMITHIMKELERLVFLPLTYANSWKHTSDKEGLTKQFAETMKRSATRLLEEDKHEARRLEEKLEQQRQQMKSNYDSLIRRRNTIEATEANLGKVDSRIISDLDLIIQHDKVKDLYVKDGKFIIHTTPIHAYHDRTGEKYYIGNMRIELNPDNTDVRFFGDNPRRSHWTGRDPHPHVNGDSGHACLGNIGATIAELSSQMELYALTLVCIDFLESVNTADSAGKNIVNWDRVREDGAIAPAPAAEEMESCTNCDREIHDNELITVFRHYDHENGAHDARRVCQECHDDHYTYWETIDQSIHNSYDEEDFFDEDGDRIGDE